MDIFSYSFMRQALIAGILLAAVISCIGVIVVLKRLSMIGDALSHASLAGVAAGLIWNINPVLGALIACVAAALGIEIIRKKIPKFSEISIAVMMSASVGLAGVLSGFVTKSANFNSFLFGSIVAISPAELRLVVMVSAVVFVLFIAFYKEFFYVAFDELSARMAGIPVNAVNFIFTMLIAAVISIASRIVGALIVSSMMVIPVTCAMQWGKGYGYTIMASVVLAIAFTVCGLFLSYYMGLKPGGAIVLTGVVFLVLIWIVKFFVKALRGE